MQKIYQLYGVNTAINLLRPGARWEVDGSRFTIWDDPRPCPSWDEVQKTMEKLKELEDSLDSMWREDQIEKLKEAGIVMPGAVK